MGKRWTVALLALIVGVATGVGTVALAHDSGPGSPCERAVAAFEATPVWRQANRPSITCLDRGPGATGGGYDASENHIDLNTNLSPNAVAEGFTRADLPELWGYLLNHEGAHAWAHAHGFDDRWVEWARLRGLPATAEPGHLQEDFAEVFALWAGTPIRLFYGPAPDYGFHNEAGRPTLDELRQYHAAGWLPDH